jgi:hypothetical protein
MKRPVHNFRLPVAAGTRYSLFLNLSFEYKEEIENELTEKIIQ